MFQMKFTYLKEPRKRHRTTPEQLSILIAAFDKQSMPDAEERKVIASKTGMTSRSVQVWFQNRRAKFRGSSPVAQTQSEARRSKHKENRSHDYMDSEYERSPKSEKGEEEEEEEEERIDVGEEENSPIEYLSNISTPDESPAISPENYLSTEDEEGCEDISSPTDQKIKNEPEIINCYYGEDVLTSWEREEKTKIESDSFLELYQIEFPS